ncbi:nucleic acid/nucleotide binding protein [Actinidia rufa]|uniref:Nucleic acid/nucleotide binding protein n=1 Tax=Actinidia rufa TaxID=165716 RepID=A0A7J0FNQ9_9ERIC|nr:nucleic acid/nucleotide binding protein [Actinidia rufa]
MENTKADSSSCLEKKKRKNQNSRYDYLKEKDMHDNLPKFTSSIDTTSIQIDSSLHHPVHACSSAYLEVAQDDAEVIISEDMDKGKEQRYNSLICNEINQDLQESGTQPGHPLSNTEYVERENDNCVSEVAEQLDSFPKCVNPSSIKKHDHDAQDDISSPEVSSIKTYQRKKQMKTLMGKWSKFSDSEVSSLGSIKDNVDSLVMIVNNGSKVVPASGSSEKMLGEVIEGYGTSSLVAGDISVGRASGEFPGILLESGKQKKISKMETLQQIVNEQIVVKGVSEADPLRKYLQWGNSDVLNVIHDAVEDVYAVKERFDSTDKVSDDASGSNPSVENLEADNLETRSKIKDVISSLFPLVAMTDEVSQSVISKEGPQKMLQSSQEGAATENFRKKLLVLDVNGLLADIVSCVSEGYKPDTAISRKAVFKRPFCDDFLQFCFESFCVGVWSSRNKRNVDAVLDFLMGKFKSNLLFCWDQSHCTDTGFKTVENKDKPLVLKELNKLWEKHVPDLPWERGEYNESNTLLLDDSPYKALRNPPHTAIFPYTYTYKDVKDNSLGPGGDLRVYLEGLASANNVQKYVELNPFGQRPITKANSSWAFYLKVIGTTSSQQKEDANNSSACQQEANNFLGVGLGRSGDDGMPGHPFVGSFAMDCSEAVDSELAPNDRGMGFNGWPPLPAEAPKGVGGCDGQPQMDAPKPNGRVMVFDGRLPLPANAPNSQGLGFNGQLLVDATKPNCQGMGFDGQLPVDDAIMPRCHRAAHDTRPPLGTLPLPPCASSTIYVEGFPPDITRREVAHIFRPFVGYKEVRLVRKKPTRYRYGGYLHVLCFVEFVDSACAAAALNSLQGYKVDEYDPHSSYLRLQFSNHPSSRPDLGSHWKR